MLSQKDYLLDLSKEKALSGFHHGPRVVCGEKQMGTTPEGRDPWVRSGSQGNRPSLGHSQLHQMRCGCFGVG